MMRWLGLSSVLLMTAGPAVSAPPPAPPAAWVEPVTAMPFVKIGKGCFRMGTKSVPFKLHNQTLQEVGYAGSYSADEQPEHEVCVSPFWMGKYEVTAEEWERIMKTPPPAGRGREPATAVSWNHAVEFAARLTTESGGNSLFRLPTEAEWEMACLAGQPELLKGEMDLATLARHAVANLAERTHRRVPRPQAVGSRLANAWGIHDMRGNAWEWVRDSYAPDAYSRHGMFDPQVRLDHGEHVIRGGSHRSEMMQLRCANRGSYPPAESLPSIGFRLVRQEAP